MKSVVKKSFKKCVQIWGHSYKSVINYKTIYVSCSTNSVFFFFTRKTVKQYFGQWVAIVYSNKQFSNGVGDRTIPLQIYVQSCAVTRVFGKEWQNGAPRSSLYKKSNLHYGRILIAFHLQPPRDGATPSETCLSRLATSLAVKTDSVKRITAICASGDSNMRGTRSPGSKRPILLNEDVLITLERFVTGERMNASSSSSPYDPGAPQWEYWDDGARPIGQRNLLKQPCPVNSWVSPNGSGGIGVRVYSRPLSAGAPERDTRRSITYYFEENI